MGPLARDYSSCSSYATHSPASLAESPVASTTEGISDHSVVRFDVHLGRDLAKKWLLQLLAVVAAFFAVVVIKSASAPISSSVSPLSLSPTFHSAASFPPVTS